MMDLQFKDFADSKTVDCGGSLNTVNYNALGTSFDGMEEFSIGLWLQMTFSNSNEYALFRLTEDQDDVTGSTT